MKYTLNGDEREYEGNLERMLLKVLKDDVKICSPKEGCSGQAYCGTCTVLVDKKPVLSCITPMKRVEGKKIETVEGLSKNIQIILAHAFVQKGGIQCGFCTPGILIAVSHLLEKTLTPTREEMNEVLNKHLCRCTGYHKIYDSILYAAQILKGESEFSPSMVEEELKRSFEKLSSKSKVGDRYSKYSAFDTALGFRPFVADIEVPQMHFGVLKFSDHPRAKVLKIDTREAEQVSGVLKILTTKDIPAGGDRFIGLIVQDWPLMVSEGEETRYIGDVLAIVIGTSEEIARSASQKIVVSYEVLNPVTDIDFAMTDDAPKIHTKGNILSHTIIKRGEIEKAIQETAFVTKGTYKTQRIEHAFLEPECALALPFESCEGGNSGVLLYTQSQGAYEDRKQVAKILGLPLNKVRVIQIQNGGAFGGKEDLTIQGHASLAAYLLKLPVRITLTREESMKMHPKRHPIRMEYEVGATKEGKLTYLKAKMVGDTGAYASVGMKVLERAAGHAAGAYKIDAVDIEAKAIYTNNVPCGAMRGFGVNQAVFAMESCIDELCLQGNFDRFDFRFQNALENGSVFTTGQVLEGVGLKETLLAVKDIFKQAKYAGIACGIKNCGVGNGMKDIGRIRFEIVSPQKINIYHGWTEMGQGVHTVAIQFLCQTVNIDVTQFEFEVTVDTAMEIETGMTTSSRATSLVGHAMINAAQKLKRDLSDKKIEELVGKVYDGEWICDWTTKPGHEKEGETPVTHYSYSYATQVVTLNDLGDVDHVYVAQDAGKVVNPLLFEGQIEGSVHMGLGYALTEDFPFKEGFPVYTRLQKCGILKAKEMPPVTIFPIEVADPHGPYGAKGVGEIGLVPTAAAVANALSLFDKERHYKLPLKRMRGTKEKDRV